MKRSSAIITILLIQMLFLTTGFSQSYYALSLVENKGQWPAAVLYRGTADAGVFFLERNGYTIMKQHPDDVEAAISTFHGGHGEKRVEPVKIISPTEGSSEEGFNRSASRSIRTHTYKVSFMGSSPSVSFTHEKPTGEVSHYFLGNDPSRWKTDVTGYAAVTGKGLYPGIDIRYYSNADNLKYDLMIAPGADPGRIVLNYEGVDGLRLDNGVLVVNTSVGASRELKPYAYQIINGYKKEVVCGYEIKGNQVRYKVKDYDKTATLVIDPDLIFSTFSGSSADNFGATAAPGPDGSLYGAGIVYNDAFAGYPTTNGLDYTKNDGTSAKLGASFSGGFVDIGITRFSKDGSSRIYSVYLGGDGEDFPHSIFVDPSGYAYILGRTNSTNFPLTTAAKGPNGGTDIILAKLSPDGRRLEASTRIGGSSRDGANVTDAILVERPESLVFNYGDHNRSEVILDKSGFVYIAVSTASDDFPTTNPTNTKSSMQDGVVMKLSPDLKTTLFTTFIGGNEDDAAFVLALHPVTNEIYAAGATRSSTLSGPGGGYRTSNSGIVDGFVAQLDISGKIVRTSFFGTDKEDFIYGIQFNKLDPAKTSYNPFIMGVSVGDWPVVGNPKYVVKDAHQFIAKLKDDLSDFVYSTTFGAPGKRPNISPVAFLVDRCENVYVSGWGGKLFPCGTGPFDLSTEGTFGLPVVSKRGNIIQNTTDGRDFYFFVLQRDAASQLYGSFFGQFGGLGDHVDGGTSRFDEKGAIYQAICAGCYSRAPIPRGVCAAFTVTRKMITTPGVVAPVVGNRRCNLGVVKIDLDFDAVESAVESEIGGKKTNEGCGPQLKVDFTDIKGDGKEYLWDFGDGSGPFKTTDPYVSHTYVSNVDRTYTVTLISTDNDRCVPTATATMTVKLSLNKANLQAKAERQGPCGSNTYLLKNLTTSPTGTPFSSSSFQWSFNDGVNPTQVTGLNDVGPINFTSNTVVQMKLIDPGFCNSSSSVDIKVNVDMGFQAKFRAVKDSVCLGEKIELIDESIGVGEYAWEFEPGNIINGYPPPTFVYPAIGDKTIKLTLSENSPGCTRSSVASINVYVKPLPLASFDYNPKGTTENMPITFTNLSTGGVSYQWSFGDGVQSNEASTVRHLYTQTGDYKARLTAFNIYGCRDDSTQIVSTTIVPLMKVPSGFTPNGDGKNDILYFYAFGLDQLVFKVYNRWGQVVFETTDPLQGWDGTYKGVPQPMDTYTYTYMIRIAGDRKSQYGKGDVTLIR